MIGRGKRSQTGFLPGAPTPGARDAGVTQARPRCRARRPGSPLRTAAAPRTRLHHPHCPVDPVLAHADGALVTCGQVEHPTADHRRERCRLRVRLQSPGQAVGAGPDSSGPRRTPARYGARGARPVSDGMQASHALRGQGPAPSIVARNDMHLPADSDEQPRPFADTGSSMRTGVGRNVHVTRSALWMVSPRPPLPRRRRWRRRPTKTGRGRRRHRNPSS